MSLKKIIVVCSLASALTLPVLADGNQTQAGPSNQGQSGPVVSNQGLPAPDTAQAGASQALQGEQSLPAESTQQGLPVSSNQSGAAVKNFFQGLGDKIKSLFSKLKKSQSDQADKNQADKVDGAQGLPLPATGQQQAKPVITGQGQAIPTQQAP